MSSVGTKKTLTTKVRSDMDSPILWSFIGLVISICLCFALNALWYRYELRKLRRFYQQRGILPTNESEK